MKYAILSHRWGRDELTFQDMKHGTGVGKEGHAKVENFFAKALSYGCRYAWFDSGCINKESSSELEESIRSMFKWYRNSEVCIVHLNQTTGKLSAAQDSATVDEWFTRGWTLQELLGPRRIKFFDSGWHPLTEDEYDVLRPWSHESEDSQFQVYDRFNYVPEEVDPKAPQYKSPLEYNIVVSGPGGTQASFASLSDHDQSAFNPTLLKAISHIIGIEIDDLLYFKPSPSQSRRVFSWVSGRQTTRSEDLAYCMIGLLDLRLSIAYGEGLAGAFQRLQQECIQRNEERDLLVWQGERSPWNSMLASDLRAFKRWPGYGSVTSNRIFACSPPGTADPSLQMTNCGLRMMLSLHDIIIETPMVGLLGGYWAFEADVRMEGSPDAFHLELRFTSEYFVPMEYMQSSWKIGILGTMLPAEGQEPVAAAILLEKDGTRAPARYTKLFTARFENFPPLSRIQIKPPEVVFIM
ncbi:hypothetical protein HGRIS_001988 [Hohenbuehelia grisea]